MVGVLLFEAGVEAMFVRAVWRIKRPVEIKQGLRETGGLGRRDADPLGLCGPEFTKMTRALFDR